MLGTAVGLAVLVRYATAAVLVVAGSAQSAIFSGVALEALADDAPARVVAARLLGAGVAGTALVAHATPAVTVIAGSAVRAAAPGVSNRTSGLGCGPAVTHALVTLENEARVAVVAQLAHVAAVAFATLSTVGADAALAVLELRRLRLIRRRLAIVTAGGKQKDPDRGQAHVVVHPLLERPILVESRQIWGPSRKNVEAV
jgi:hypothetical protein